MGSSKKLLKVSESQVEQKRKVRFRWNGNYFYLLPWFIGLLVFRIYPFIDAFLISLERSGGIGREPVFVGLSNYTELLFGNTQSGEVFRHSLGVTFRYVALTVPLVLVFALFIAFILNFKIKGIGFFRTTFYVPSILGGSVSVAILWRFVWGNQGLINSFLEAIGFEAVGWLVNPATAMIVLVLLRAWQFGSVMLIFLSALQGVPASLYEAASIDGASKVRQFFTVTVPIITPVILFNAVQLLVSAFQEFNASFLVTEGGPLNATQLLNLFIYQRAFLNLQFGIASAASWIMAVIIMFFTVIIFKTSNKWVHYSD